MNRNVLEIRSFRLVPGAGEADLIRAADTTTRLLRGQRGFLARSLAQSEDGSWTDIVHWLDRASARAGGDRLKEHDAARAYSALIDPPTLTATLCPLAFSA